MKTEKEQLETISFRGKRDLWLKFVYTTKRKKEKNTWNVLSKLIENYIKNNKMEE